MTNNQNAGLSLVTVSGALDVSDVLSVVTSRAELRLHQELDGAKRRLAEAQAAVKKLEEEAGKLYESECKAAGEKVAAKLRAAVESVGGKVRVGEKDHWDKRDRRRNTDGLLENSVVVVAPGNQCRDTAVFTATAAPSRVLLATEESLMAARRDVEERQEEALRARKKLANVPLLERKARARLAEAKLAESEDGRAVLAALTDEFEADFLALPGN